MAIQKHAKIHPDSEHHPVTEAEKLGINHTTTKAAAYRWRGFGSRHRKYVSQKDKTPIAKEKLEQSRCHRRTCRKLYTPIKKRQVLCPTCLTEVEKKQKKARIEEQLRALSGW